MPQVASAAMQLDELTASIAAMKEHVMQRQKVILTFEQHPTSAVSVLCSSYAAPGNLQ